MKKKSALAELPRVSLLEGLEWWREQEAKAAEGRKRALAAAKKARKKLHQSVSAKWPMKSDSLGCHPEQVGEANERAKKAGIQGVHYERDGTCVINDNGARKKLMRLEKCIDRSGYS